MFDDRQLPSFWKMGLISLLVSFFYGTVFFFLSEWLKGNDLGQVGIILLSVAISFPFALYAYAVWAMKVLGLR